MKATTKQKKKMAEYYIKHRNEILAKYATHYIEYTAHTVVRRSIKHPELHMYKGQAYKQAYMRVYNSPERNSWAAMIARCTDPRRAKYKLYGAIGVTVCKRWMKFAHFLADMGLRASGMTLGRYRDIGNYKPSNCKWMTRKEQEVEKRKKKVMLFKEQKVKV
jgi:hypothetical protein